MRLTNNALQKIDLASFIWWYVVVELQDPIYSRLFYNTYEFLEESMLKVAPPALLSTALPLLPTLTSNVASGIATSRRISPKPEQRTFNRSNFTPTNIQIQI